MHHRTEKLIIKRVADYGPKPRSVVQALRQAHAFLTEEGQWITGAFFEDGDPKEAYEKSACSSWKACAMGALGLVTGESPVKVTREWDGTFYRTEEEAAENDGIDYLFSFNDAYNHSDTPLSAAAAIRVAQVIDPDLGWYTDEDDNGNEIREKEEVEDYEAVDKVINFNDHGLGRTGVLDAFAQAIRASGAEPIVDHTKSPLAIKRALNRAKRAQAK